VFTDTKMTSDSLMDLSTSVEKKRFLPRHSEGKQPNNNGETCKDLKGESETGERMTYGRQSPGDRARRSGESWSSTRQYVAKEGKGQKRVRSNREKMKAAASQEIVKKKKIEVNM